LRSQASESPSCLLPTGFDRVFLLSFPSVFGFEEINNDNNIIYFNNNIIILF